MEIIPVKPNLAGGPVFPGAAAKADAVKEVAPKAQNATTDKAVVLEQQVKDVSKTELRGAEKERFEVVLKASRMFKNVYAVSDMTFTIFKDGNGQFVTRFTSLKDGSVTYIPEPEILQYMESVGERRAAMIEVEA